MVFHDVDKRIKSLINQMERKNINVDDIRKNVYDINDILQLQKDLISNRNFKLINISDLMKKFNLYSKYRIEDHNIELKIQTEPEDFKIKCIESQILRVLMNLLDNSIYWLKVINNDKKIIIKIIKEDNKCVIYFADNGPGLGVEDPNLLFKPFVTKKDEGLGLGLYIVNEIISIHNGRIEVITDNDNVSSEYTGAKFKIELNME